MQPALAVKNLLVYLAKRFGTASSTKHSMSWTLVRKSFGHGYTLARHMGNLWHASKHKR